MSSYAAAATTRIFAQSPIRARRPRSLSTAVKFPAQSSCQDSAKSVGIYLVTCTQPRVLTVACSPPSRKRFLEAPLEAQARTLCAAGKASQSNGQVISPALLAMALAIVAAATSPQGSRTAALGSEMKSSGSGGNGGSTGPETGPLYVPVAPQKEVAKDDVRRLQTEAAGDPYTVSSGAVQGARWTMEDTFYVDNGGRFVAVFDGHGGSEVSARLRDKMFNMYCKALAEKHWEETDDFSPHKTRIPSATSHVGALRIALEQVELEVLSEDDLVYQGSTAVVVVVHDGDDGRKTLLSANVGDSRAILSRNGKAVDLTRDHKPNDEREKARIRAFGEEVEWDPYGQVYRVRDLSLSRAIGDRFAKPVVTSEPEIKHFPLSDEEDEFVLLASDGLWDVMNSQEVVDFIRETLSATERSQTNDVRRGMAKQLANEALERGSADNVCVLLVWLK